MLDWIKRNWMILTLFIISTLFFCYQHSQILVWDFAVYVENAKYWLGQSLYFEHTRPPVISLLLAGFSFAGWNLAEYLFIIAASAGFAFSSYRLAKATNINPTLFYFISLSPYVLLYGLTNGSELVSIIFLELFVAFLLERKSYGSVFLSLAFLTRYNFMVFFPMLILYWKKFLKSLAFFILPITLWLLYNLVATGNMLTSIADVYAKDVLLRGYYSGELNLHFIFLVISFSLPFLIIGLYHLKSIIITISKKKISAIIDDPNFVMLIVTAFSLYQYFSIPLKDIRYIFPLVIPVAYFAAKGLSSIKKYSQMLFTYSIIALLITTTAFVSSATLAQDNAYDPSEVISVLEELNISHCRTASNVWALITYGGKATEPFPREQLVRQYIDEGGYVIHYYWIPEPAYDLDILPYVFKNDKFVILGDKCAPERAINKPYLHRLHDDMKAIHGFETNTNPCFVMFENSALFERTCNLFNGNDFTLDTNRNLT